MKSFESVNDFTEIMLTARAKAEKFMATAQQSEEVCLTKLKLEVAYPFRRSIVYA